MEGKTSYKTGRGLWQGVYVLEFVDQENWRELLIIGPFQQLRTAEKGQIAITRNDEYSSAASNILSLPDWLSVLQIDPTSEKSTKSKFQKVNGTQATCFSIAQSSNKEQVREVCVSTESGLYIGDREGGVRYSDYRPFGTFLVPFKMSDGDFSELTVTSIGPLRGFTLNKTTPMKIMRGCFTPRHSLLLRKVSPDYPATAVMARMSGQVQFNAVINESGALAEISPTKDSNKFLLGSALNAVKQWKYRPASCGGTPVAFETFITVNFDMSRMHSAK